MAAGDGRAQGATRTPSAPGVKKQKTAPGSSTRVVLPRKPRTRTPKVGKRPYQRINVVGMSALSVFRVVLVFYSLMALVFLVAGMILWTIASRAGLVLKLNHLIRSLTGSSTYSFRGTQVLVVAVGFLVVLVAIGSILTAISVRIFNMVMELVGGIGLNVRAGASNVSQSG